MGRVSKGEVQVKNRGMKICSAMRVLPNGQKKLRISK